MLNESLQVRLRHSPARTTRHSQHLQTQNTKHKMGTTNPAATFCSHNRIYTYVHVLKLNQGARRGLRHRRM